VISMLLAELAARAKADGLTLHEKLAALFRRYGDHLERTFTVRMPGAEGMQEMKALMSRARRQPPAELAGMKVALVRDYGENVVREGGGPDRPLPGPTGDLVIYDLTAEGNAVAIRPSGTEPLVKFYLYGHQPVGEQADLTSSHAVLAARLDALERNLRTYAGG
jgi:phosphomannomutase